MLKKKSSQRRLFRMVYSKKVNVGATLGTFSKLSNLYSTLISPKGLICLDYLI